MLKIVCNVLFLGLVICTLSSCATDPNRWTYAQGNALRASIVGAPADSITPILALNENIKEILDSRIDSNWRAKKKLNELRKFLYSGDEINIVYESGKSGSAIETFNSRRGNCLALTTLFIAASRHVGVDARYQSVTITPHWDHQSGTLIRYEHIVAHGKLPGESYIIDFLPQVDAQNTRGRIVSDKNALAMYYTNLGAQAFVQGHLDTAFTRYQYSLNLNQRNSATWNNVGAVLFRQGELEKAEFSYLEALSIDAENYSAHSNLLHLYESVGNSVAAEKLGRKVTRYRAKNPYYQFFQAQQLMIEGKTSEALDSLHRAVKLKDNEPMFYEALGEVYGGLGKQALSKSYFLLAIKNKKSHPVYPGELSQNESLIISTETPPVEQP